MSGGRRVGKRRTERRWEGAPAARRGTADGRRCARAAAAITVALAAMYILPTDAAAQDADDPPPVEYDFQTIRFRGIGLEGFFIAPSGVESTGGFGARFDLTFRKPAFRIMPRITYWKSDVKEEEIAKLERRVEDLIDEVGGDPGPVALGPVKRSSFLIGADFQWLPETTGRLDPYLGAGLDIYILNGSGPVIAGTFVEDALDFITVGVSAVAGLEIELTSYVSFYADARGSLVTDVSSFAATGGLLFFWDR